jgi:branched-chain amino acid transport system substrate-binding protein
MQLLGSSGWDSPKLIEFVQPQASSIEGAVFTDAFFGQSPEPVVRDFVQEFHTTFGYEPEIYEATAYETARIIATVISEQRVSDRLKMRDALAGLKDFPSFSGYVQAQPDRSFRRPLFVLQVRQGQIVDISTTSRF